MAKYVEIFPGMGVGQQWGYVYDSNGTTRPSAISSGVTITPAQNAYGTYTNVGAVTAQDVYLIEVSFSNGATAGAARDMIANISIDGGTTALIPDLSASSACNNVTGPGITYYFPLWIRSGAQFSCAVSVNNGTVGTVGCRVRAFGAPYNQKLVRAGRFVRSFGIDAANSRGTTVVSGTAAEGAYANIGSVTAEELWFWQMGFFYNQATSNNFHNYMDLAVNNGIADTVVIENQEWTTTSAEVIWNKPYFGAEFRAPAGSQVKARMQSSGSIAADTTISAYGVGG